MLTLFCNTLRNNMHRIQIMWSQPLLKILSTFKLVTSEFLDSLQFLTAPLDVLVQNLITDGRDKFFHTTRHYLNSDLVFSKGVYPYEFMDGHEKFLLTDLPPIDAFYSSLTEASISTAEYERYTGTQKEWQEFGIKTCAKSRPILKSRHTFIGRYFENFRKTCIAVYGLDPCRYYILPGFTFEACLKCTGQELDLFTNSEMFLFI